MRTRRSQAHILCALTFQVFQLFALMPTLFADMEIVAVTFATDNTHGFQRFRRSANQYGINPVVLGMGEEWKGGNIQVGPGGAHKLIALRKYLAELPDAENKIIVFTDGYDVVYQNDLGAIKEKFLKFDANIVFSAERSCWPDAELAEKYPRLPQGGYRFLNSGAFIGYANELYRMLTTSANGRNNPETNEVVAESVDDIKYDDDDQLYYTRKFLDERDEFGIKLDTHAAIFQNLYLANVDVLLRFNASTHDAYVENTEYRTVPAIIHGNGRSKIILNSLSNYLAGAWNNRTGCHECLEHTIDLKSAKTYPTVLIAVFIEQPTPFLEEFLKKISEINYPSNKINVLVHNTQSFHDKVVTNFVEVMKNKGVLSVKVIASTDNTSENQARNWALELTTKLNCDYLFVIDSIAHVDNPDTLQLLIAQNRAILAPMLTRVGKTWSNFWGALNAEGYYARSFDYMDIVHRKKVGVWNVPFINAIYLINATLLRTLTNEINYDTAPADADMSFCQRLRRLDVFMHVTNRHEFGHLINADYYDADSPVPELFHIFDNKPDWEARYIAPLYVENFNPDKKHLQPCPDVFWFPVTTERFCKDLIQLVETYGKWSDGTNNDNRLTGGYEAVPTRDIHMNQVGFERHWLYFLKEYVRPLQELVFIGYYHNPPRSLMNFVVRYRPDEQPFLRPHHDSSTYTINLALNTPGEDYEGGGCRFIRYNCSVPNTKPGWLLMHPGRLTHFHEGLLVTKGTRYIMISFVDP